MITGVLFFVAHQVPSVASRLDQLTELVSKAEGLAVGLGLLLSTGLTGIVLAFRSLIRRLRGVEVNGTAQLLQNGAEHQQNVGRLQDIQEGVTRVGEVETKLAQLAEDACRIRDDAAQTRQDVAEIRDIMLRLLSEKAGLK